MKNLKSASAALGAVSLMCGSRAGPDLRRVIPGLERAGLDKQPARVYRPGGRRSRFWGIRVGLRHFREPEYHRSDHDHATRAGTMAGVNRARNSPENFAGRSPAGLSVPGWFGHVVVGLCKRSRLQSDQLTCGVSAPTGTPIPTLGEWTLVALTAVVGLVRDRRRTAQARLTTPGAAPDRVERRSRRSGNLRPADFHAFGARRRQLHSDVPRLQVASTSSGSRFHQLLAEKISTSWKPR